MKYFSLPELEYTSQPEFKGGILNVALGQERKNLVTLVEQVLDPIREHWGSPIFVTSGYRCPLLNKKVGGVANSYHLRGMAADITAKSVFYNTALYTEIRILHQQGLLPLTECYMERQGLYIHLAYDPENINSKPFFTK